MVVFFFKCEGLVVRIVCYYFDFWRVYGMSFFIFNVYIIMGLDFELSLQRFLIFFFIMFVCYFEVRYKMGGGIDN